MMKVLLVAIALTCFCPIPARAIAKDELYLEQLNRYLSADTSPFIGNPYLEVDRRSKLRDGYEVCSKLDSGRAIASIRLSENKTIAAMGDEDSWRAIHYESDVVLAAIDNLCPKHRAKVER